MSNCNGTGVVQKSLLLPLKRADAFWNGSNLVTLSGSHSSSSSRVLLLGSPDERLIRGWKNSTNQSSRHAWMMPLHNRAIRYYTILQARATAEHSNCLPDVSNCESRLYPDRHPRFVVKQMFWSARKARDNGQLSSLQRRICYLPPFTR